MTGIRIYLDSGVLGTYELTAPIWNGAVSYVQTKGVDDYEVEFDGELTMRGADFLPVKSHEGVPCQEITVLVMVQCSGGWVEKVRGRFTFNQCSIDYDKCLISVKPLINDGYKCARRVFDVEQIYYGNNHVTVRPSVGTFYIFGCCSYISPTYTQAPCNDFNITDACPNVTVTQLIGGDYRIETCYERIEVTSATSPGSGWQLITGQTNKWWKCAAQIIDIGIHKRGRLFKDWLQSSFAYALSNCGVIKVSSAFFDLNTSGLSAPANLAYSFAAANLRYLTVHQKSDVKCSTCTNMAAQSAWAFKLEDIMSDLQIMFNVVWWIEGDTLRIEHVSYKQRQTIDLTGKRMQNSVIVNEREIVRSERWAFSDDNQSFVSERIDYNCGEKVIDRVCRVFNNDIIRITQSANPEDVSDKGLVLMCTAPSGSGDYILQQNNAPLLLRNLIENLHLWERPQSSFQFYGNTFNAVTVEGQREQPEFSYVQPCNADFDPSDFLQTGIGIGRVTSARYNLQNCTLNLKVKYP